MDLTILITTINEAENLATLLPLLKSAFSPHTRKFEILIVDGGSTDDTVAVAKRHGARVTVQKMKGYASAIRQGIEEAAGAYLIVMDADHSHTPQDALNLFLNRNKADIVINSRYAPGGGSDAPFLRRALSWTLNFAYRTVLQVPFQEISGGFRVYRREILTGLNFRSSFYEIQEELLLVAHWHGYSAVEIPYTYRDRKEGASKARILKYGLHLFLALFRLRQVRRSIRSEAKEHPPEARLTQRRR